MNEGYAFDTRWPNFGSFQGFYAFAEFKKNQKFDLGFFLLLFFLFLLRVILLFLSMVDFGKVVPVTALASASL